MLADVNDAPHEFREGDKVWVEDGDGKHHPGIFVGRGKEDLLLTKNLVPGESVYGEKRIAIETPAALALKSPSDAPTTNGTTTNDLGMPEAPKLEYRVWNPFRSKLAAGVLGGLDDIYMKPGAKVLYLGAASGTSVSRESTLLSLLSLSSPAFRLRRLLKIERMSSFQRHERTL